MIMATKDIKRRTNKTAKCDYCEGYFEPEKVGNHPTNDFNEKYCDNCSAELDEPSVINPYSEAYVNAEY